MPSESEIILSFLFKRSGRTKLSYSDLYLALSMDLNWFTPDDAKAFIDSSLKKELLTKKGETIQPNFEYDKISVPVGFTPSERIFEEKSEKRAEKDADVFDKIIKHLAKKSNLNEGKIKNEIEATAKKKNITQEVAALVVCKEHNVPIDDFLKDVEKNIFKESKE